MAATYSSLVSFPSSASSDSLTTSASSASLATSASSAFFGFYCFFCRLLFVTPLLDSRAWGRAAAFCGRDSRDRNEYRRPYISTEGRVTVQL